MASLKITKAIVYLSIVAGFVVAPIVQAEEVRLTLKSAKSADGSVCFADQSYSVAYTLASKKGGQALKIHGVKSLRSSAKSKSLLSKGRVHMKDGRVSAIQFKGTLNGSKINNVTLVEKTTLADGSTCRFSYNG